MANKMEIDGIVKDMLADTEGENNSANFDRLYHEIIGEAADYCFIPDRYVRNDFAMEKPTPSQQQAIEILTLMLEEQDPLRPALSLYLHGPVGTGKTHIVAAYATKLANMLQSKVEERKMRAQSMISSSIHAMRGHIREFNSCLQQAERLADAYDPLNDKSVDSLSLQTWVDHGGDDSYKEVRGKYVFDQKKIDAAKQKKKQEIMAEAMQEKQRKLDMEIEQEMDYLNPRNIKCLLEKAGVKYTETDIVFVEFERLLPMVGSKPELLEELIRAPVLIIDDIHPKGEEERAKAIQFIFEQRYNRATGGTFVTSNLSPSELLKVGKYDPKISERLESRCAEMFIVIDTSDASDYRQVIMKRKADEVLKRLAAARQAGK